MTAMTAEASKTSAVVLSPRLSRLKPVASIPAAITRTRGSLSSLRSALGDINNAQEMITSSTARTPNTKGIGHWFILKSRYTARPSPKKKTISAKKRSMARIDRICSFLSVQPMKKRRIHGGFSFSGNSYRIFDTTPAPTVRPPSRIAKRSPSSMAIGVISSIVNFALSPGITISTPSSSLISPVTSVVRK